MLKRDMVMSEHGDDERLGSGRSSNGRCYDQTI